MSGKGKSGYLKVTVVEGRALKDTGFVGLQDPYVIVKLGKEERRSKTHKSGGVSPQWNEELDHIRLQNTAEHPTLQVEIFNENFLLKDDPIGTTQIPLAEVYEQGIVENSFSVRTASDRLRGSISLIIRFSEDAPNVSFVSPVSGSTAGVSGTCPPPSSVSGSLPPVRPTSPADGTLYPPNSVGRSESLGPPSSSSSFNSLPSPSPAPDDSYPSFPTAQFVSQERLSSAPRPYPPGASSQTPPPSFSSNPSPPMGISSTSAQPHPSSSAYNPDPSRQDHRYQHPASSNVYPPSAAAPSLGASSQSYLPNVLSSSPASGGPAPLMHTQSLPANTYPPMSQFGGGGGGGGGSVTSGGSTYSTGDNGRVPQINRAHTFSTATHGPVSPPSLESLQISGGSHHSSLREDTMAMPRPLSHQQSPLRDENRLGSFGSRPGPLSNSSSGSSLTGASAAPRAPKAWNEDVDDDEHIIEAAPAPPPPPPVAVAMAERVSSPKRPNSGSMQLAQQPASTSPDLNQPRWQASASAYGQSVQAATPTGMPAKTTYPTQNPAPVHAASSMPPAYSVSAPGPGYGPGSGTGSGTGLGKRSDAYPTAYASPPNVGEAYPNALPSMAPAHSGSGYGPSSGTGSGRRLEAYPSAYAQSPSVVETYQKQSSVPVHAAMSVPPAHSGSGFGPSPVTGSVKRTEVYPTGYAQSPSLGDQSSAPVHAVSSGPSAHSGLGVSPSSGTVPSAHSGSGSAFGPGLGQRSEVYPNAYAQSLSPVASEAYPNHPSASVHSGLGQRSEVYPNAYAQSQSPVAYAQSQSSVASESYPNQPSAPVHSGSGQRSEMYPSAYAQSQSSGSGQRSEVYPSAFAQSQPPVASDTYPNHPSAPVHSGSGQRSEVYPNAYAQSQSPVASEPYPSHPSAPVHPGSGFGPAQGFVPGSGSNSGQRSEVYLNAYAPSSNVGGAYPGSGVYTHAPNPSAPSTEVSYSTGGLEVGYPPVKSQASDSMYPPNNSPYNSPAVGFPAADIQQNCQPLSDYGRVSYRPGAQGDVSVGAVPQNLYPPETGERRQPNMHAAAPSTRVPNTNNVSDAALLLQQQRYPPTMQGYSASGGVQQTTQQSWDTYSIGAAPYPPPSASPAVAYQSSGSNSKTHRD